MRRKVALLLIALSLALNVAFVTVWALHALPPLMRRGGSAGTEGIWCPLHRKLAATEAQWREIEPRLVEFQNASREVCGEVNQSRSELIDLLAAADPDMEAIQAKQEEILAGQRRMQQLVIDYLLADKRTLTPEQQRQLFEMLRQRAECAGQGPIAGPMRGGPSCGGPGPGKHGRMMENE